MPIQIWTIFWVQMGFQEPGRETQIFQATWQQSFPTGIKSDTERSRIQPVYAIEESAGHCSRKLCWRWNPVPCDDTYSDQWHGWTTKTGSPGGWRSGSSKEKDLCASVVVQCGKPENSYAQVQLYAGNKEDDKSQQIVYVNHKLEGFIYLLDVMNSVNDRVFTSQPVSNVLKKIVPSFYNLSFS